MIELRPNHAKQGSGEVFCLYGIDKLKLSPERRGSILAPKHMALVLLEPLNDLRSLDHHINGVLQEALIRCIGVILGGVLSLETNHQAG